MIHRFLVTLILLTIAWPGASHASLTSLVSFELSLAGYQLGMSFDDVAKIRPFRYEQSSIEGTDNTATFYALIDHVYVDGAALCLQVSFKDEKVHKIVARMSPDFFENVKRNIEQALGVAEDKSRVFGNYNNEEIYQTIYLWDFPNAKIHLINVSSNHEFVTISLTSK